MSEITPEEGDLIKCERAVIQARSIIKRKVPSSGTSRDKCEEAFARTTVRIRIERKFSLNVRRLTD